MLSLPSRECGLKLTFSIIDIPPVFVTPFAGVWIEMKNITVVDPEEEVTPFAGVWIEIHLLS